MSGHRSAPFTPRETRLIGAFFLLALLLRGAIALQPLEYTDRLFVPDDTYYTLSIARSLAAGTGPSVDGVTSTNGFQPLQAFVEAPLFFIGASPDAGLRGALLSSALAGALAVGLIGVLLLRTCGFEAAGVGMLCALLSPFVLRNDLNGLETSLAGLLALALAIGMLRVESAPGARVRVVLGVVCGLALLARVDTVFLVAGVGLYGLARWGVSATAQVVAGACVVVAPWWGYSLLRFGTFVPTSGAAVHEIVEFHRALYLTRAHELDYALNALALWFPADSLFGAGALSLLLGLVVVGAVVTFGLRSLSPGPGRDVLRLLAASAAVQWFFYAFYLPAFWFHGRYFHTIGLVLCVLAGAAAGRLLAPVAPDDADHPPRSTWPKQVLGVTLLLYLGGALLGVGAFFSRPDQTIETGVRGAKGYRDVALEVRERLPAGGVVAAMQSGAIGYYAEGRFAVVNLDGVVNPAAHAAIQERGLGRLLREARVDYFVDWDVNVRMLAHYFGEPFDHRCLEPVFETKPQGMHRFVAYRVAACIANPGAARTE